MGMILRIASSRIVGQGDIVGRSGYFSLNLSANSVMRGRLDARRTLKSLVADLRSIRRLEIICKSKDKDIPLEYIEALEMIMKLKSKEQASYNPAVDREKLHIWLDLVYDDFAGRLLEKYQLTGRERDVCYLKALDFSDDEISELLKIQLRSEERWIYRICEKFGFPKGSKDDFAAYIADFKKRR